MSGLSVVVEADGGSRGNPGIAGYGAVVKDATTGTVLAERSQALGIATNNVAEYSGLIAGLEAAAELGATQVEVRMDSKLVIEQMAGRWQIKHPGLRPLAAAAATLVRRFAVVRYQWIPREQNRHADALANRAMDAGAAVVSAPAATAATTPSPSSWEPRTEAPTRLILVRHGETALTAQKRYSGRGDVPLSTTGQEQAKAAATRVPVLGPPAAIVTSPLGRCRQTAEAIAAACGGVEVTVDEAFIECDFGIWEGMTFAEVRAEYPVELQKWLDSTAVAPPKGESFQKVAKRVRGGVATLRSAYPGGVVVVVSHVSPIKLILRDALAASDALLHRLYLDPAGISIVDLYADGGVAVRTVNDTAHIVRSAQ